MNKKKRIPLALAALTLAVSGHAYSLGLGDVTLHSALNQPLSADIELLQVGNLSTDELIARLASEASFQQAGVERFLFLNDLRFTPVIRGGRGYIRVTSTQPVREPYLNFLLEVERPNGRLMREYTLLFDPPEYAPVATRSVASEPYRIASPQPVRERPAAFHPAVQGEPAVAGEGRYLTVRNDTLWRIASRLGASGAQHKQLMADIYQLNPQAFIGGDAHRLRVGQTLVLPAGRQAPSAPPQAVPAVAPTVAARPAEVAAAPAVPAADAQVKAELAGISAERTELNERLDSMAQQLDALQKALEARDQQIQTLQAEVQRRQADAAAAAKAQAAAPAVTPSAAPVEAAAKPAVAEAAAEPPIGWRWLTVGGLLALLGGLLLARHRRQGEPDGAPLAQQVREPEPVREEPVQTRLQLQLPVVETLPAVAPVRAPAAAPVADATVIRLPTASADGLEGANIYIAYGRFGHARDMLSESIAQSPQRLDMRIKLMTVLAELGDVSGFHEQESEYLELGGDRREVEQIVARYPVLQKAATEVKAPAAVEKPRVEKVEEAETAPEPLTDWDDLELDEPAVASQGRPPEKVTEELDDVSWDLDWDSLDLDNPLENPLCRKSPARLAEPEDFTSNLFELPEVTEFDPGSEQAGVFRRQDELVESDLLGDLEEVPSQHDELLVELDRARRCIDEGNLDEAYGILKRIIENGDSEESAEARELLAKIA